MDLWILCFLLAVAACVASNQLCDEHTTSLKLFAQSMKALPDLSACAANLTHLDLSSNQIHSISPEIGNFVNLQVLLLNNNFIQELPAEIGNLLNLRVLWANNNQLSSIPASIGKLTKLRELRVDDNRINQLTIEISYLRSLTQLYAGGNSLTKLPRELGHLSRLILLSVPSNNLTEIPAEFGGMSSLITFAAYDNRMRCLPRALWALPRISVGDLYLPACSNRTVEGYLTSRAAEKNTCKGTASSVNRTALGCFDYVHTSCSMTATEVTVTTRRLSDLSSQGLSCAPGAPQLGATEVTVFPRCDWKTGVTMTCAGVFDAFNAGLINEGIGRP